jgi:hypothetical protein
MHVTDILNYYSKPEIQEAIASFAKDREIACSLRDGSYFHRPDTLQYPRDVLERVKEGVVAFHCSVERWASPMSLSSELRTKDLDELRKGFDVILDIDAKSKLEHAKIAAITICEFLSDQGITPTVKFSGRRGFHIGISGDAFPNQVDFKPLSKMYPDVPQIMAAYIKNQIKDKLLEALIEEEGGIASLAKTVPELSELSPYSFIEVEENWGNRHLFRMPYSLHHKSWLASIPLRLYKLKGFETSMALPNKVKISSPFLINKEEEGTDLIRSALDWHSRYKKEEKIVYKKVFKKTAPVPEEYFPPCIKLILNGVPDGRKRSFYTLATFLRAVNWKWEDIEKRLKEWNDSTQALTTRAVSTQMKWHARQKRDLMPANCDSVMFYKSIGICKPDGICERIKNPVNYAFRRLKKKA